MKIEDNQSRKNLEKFIKFQFILRDEEISDEEVDRLIHLADCLFSIEKEEFKCTDCRRDFIVSHLKKPSWVN